MDVGHVKGSGGVGRNPDRSDKVDRGKVAGQGDDHLGDRTSISDDGREFLSAVDEMSEQLKKGDPRREERLLEVSQKLQRGELDQPKIFRAVADAMFEAEF